MLNECIDGLNVKENGIYFDGTLGGGGHSYEIVKRLNSGKLFATDLDDYAISRANERLKEFNGKFVLIKDNFKNVENIKNTYNIDGFDGIILDLGVSSFQLDDRERGFSYLAEDITLDMRMNRDNPLTAEYVVNNYSLEELKKIFFEYGEEKFSSAIAKKIVETRKTSPIKTVGELNKIIAETIPKKLQNNGHPSKRVFQALRIEVNGELNWLYETVITMARLLKPKGRICIITFHSLEDRIVKKAFKELESDCVCDKSLPVCVCGKKKEIKLLTNHPITASEKELLENSRSKSAKLRIAEKI